MTRTTKLPLATLLALETLLVASSLQAQNPAPAAVLNPASNIPVGHFNWGIAQGSIFVVYPAFDQTGKIVGGSLGPATIVTAPSLPLGTTLSGTSIKVTVGSVSVDCPMVYTLKSQVAAVLPSTTPLGAGTLTVTYNGASGSTPIRVVGSNFGISTVDGSGTGAAVVTFPSYQLVDSTHSAKPGDTLVIWGTGLGAANSDANIATNGDLKTNITVWIGGVAAPLQYRGRSAGPGLDQINVVVPDGVSPGCSVSLVIQTGGAQSLVLSNTTNIPIMPGGGTCSDPGLTGITPATISGLLAKPTARLAALQFQQDNTISAPTFSASINAIFLSFTQQQLASQLPKLINNTDPSLGSCQVALVAGNPGGGGGDSLPNATQLDAGASIVFTAPSGPALTATGTPLVKGFYGATPTSALSGGAWQAANGKGGADIAPFSVAFQLAQPVAWSNKAASIDRTQSYLVKWTGGDPNGYVRISGSTGFGNGTGSNGIATFVCTAPAGTGQFTIPNTVLGNLGSTGTSFGFFELRGLSTTPVAIPTIDLAFLSWENSTQYSPAWK